MEIRKKTSKKKTVYVELEDDGDIVRLLVDGNCALAMSNNEARFYNLVFENLGIKIK